MISAARLGTALGFACALLLLSGLSFAHQHQHHGHHHDDDDVKFECTGHGGAVFGCTNLSASCAEWWPNCSKKPVRWPQRFPHHCENARFVIVRYPVANSDNYIHHHSYSHYNSNHNHHSQTNQYHHESGKHESTHDEGPPHIPPPPGSAGHPAAGEPAPPDVAPLSLQNPVASGLKASSFPAPGASSSESSGGAKHASAAPDRDSSSKAAGQPAAGVKAEGGSPGSGQPGSSSARNRTREPGAPADSVDASAQGAAAQSSETQKSENYSDPWLDYVSAQSKEELVRRLAKNRKERDSLREKIQLAMVDGKHESPQEQERLSYLRSALSAAEKLSSQGSLDALAPLDAQEAFAMNGDETDQEIRRILASLEPEAGGNDGETALFPRVHHALWRQLAGGKIALPHRKKR